MLQSQDCVKVAFQSLKQLEQTSSVAEYKANFDVLCMPVKIAPEQQLLYWYDGLKKGLVSKTNFDLVTKKPHASMYDAQSLALAVDTHSGGPNGQGGLTSQGGSNSHRPKKIRDNGNNTTMRQIKQGGFNFQLPRCSCSTTQWNTIVQPGRYGS